MFFSRVIYKLLYHRTLSVLKLITQIGPLYGMCVGSDNNKLSIAPAVVPGIFVDPPTPELNAKASSPRKKGHPCKRQNGTNSFPNFSKQITKDLVLRSRI